MIIWTKLNTMLAGYSRRPNVAVCAFALGLLFLLGTAPLSPAAKPVTTVNCRNQVVIDYSEALSELPPVRQVPRSGRLPFGGDGVTLRPVTQSQVKVNGTSFGYALSLDGPLSKFDPGWQVEAQLLQVNSDGSARKLIQRRHRLLGVPRSLTDLNFSFRLRSEPGFYKYEIRFIGEGGRALGRYSQYLRIVKPRVGGDLKLSKDSTTPDSSLQFQIANPGTIPFAAGVTPVIEHWDVTGWREAEFPQGRAVRKALRLEAGSASSCFELFIPPSAPYGLYRISLKISPSLLPSRWIRNRFEVLTRSIRGE